MKEVGASISAWQCDKRVNREGGGERDERESLYLSVAMGLERQRNLEIVQKNVNRDFFVCVFCCIFFLLFVFVCFVVCLFFLVFLFFFYGGNNQGKEVHGGSKSKK